jgi:hypothetical protein
LGFYYTSLLSVLALAIAYGALAIVFAMVFRISRGMRGRTAMLSAVALIFMVLPVSEEFWIAWNFSRACKQAGTFIHKQVVVEGFYDDTTHWWRQLADSKFTFVESRDNPRGSLWRVERDGNELKHFKIERPTARYHYKMPFSHAAVAHKVVRHETVVVDTTSGDLVARYTRFSRRAPWFYSGTPGEFSCDADAGWPTARGTFEIYEKVLIPRVSK